MKLNCQVFKEEISMVHLNRQMAHLQNALQESYVKVLQKTAGPWNRFPLCRLEPTSWRSGALPMQLESIAYETQWHQYVGKLCDHSQRMLWLIKINNTKLRLGTEMTLAIDSMHGIIYWNQLLLRNWTSPFLDNNAFAYFPLSITKNLCNILGITALFLTNDSQTV